MGWLERDRLAEILDPRSSQEIGKGEDEIDRDVVEIGRSQRLERSRDRRDIVHAMHPPQRLGVKRLPAYGNTVDPRPSPGPSRLRGNVVGIDLDRDLRVRNERP